MVLADRSLSYELAGVLGSRSVLDVLARAHPSLRAVPLDVPDLAVVPVTPDIAGAVTPAALCALGLDRIPGGTSYAQRRRSTWLTGPESGFAVLTPGLVALVEAGSALGPVAYVEADYHGFVGRQAAAVWRSGRLVTGPLLLGRQEESDREDDPVLVALRVLGVAALDSRDEFAVAGLGRHERTGDWLCPP